MEGQGGDGRIDVDLRTRVEVMMEVVEANHDAGEVFLVVRQMEV